MNSFHILNGRFMVDYTFRENHTYRFQSYKQFVENALDNFVDKIKGDNPKLYSK